MFERIATRQHEGTNALRMVHGDQLRHHTAGVVADQHDVVQIQRGQGIGDDAGHSMDGAVGTGAQRLGMGAQRPGRNDAPQPPRGQA